ncbi:glycosyltransferase [Glutamicibacter creatinolyticus]|uniref:glycosyltransferase n=1 Tax=Glutamicibacter creatinolyticus TaxID=162496 RepID=UPI003CCC6E58
MRNQSRPIERFIGVDASSTDGSAQVLSANLPSNALIVRADKHSLGLSVAEAVASLPDARADRDEWLWIIHDDSMPAPDALEALTTVVEASESVTIAGCKLLDIDSPRRLIDVGLSTDRKAQRLTMVDIDEVDQGQYDARSDYFAVSSAGMFIRRDVFEELGGFDPALPGRGDDIDLCWRNRLAGHRVVVVPAAKMYHRTDVHAALAGPKEARRSEVYLRLKHASAPALPFVWLGILLAGIGHFFLSLLAKDPGHAFNHLGATLRGLFSPVKLAASRRQAKASRRVSRHQATRLMVPAVEVREYRRNLSAKAEEHQVFGDGTGAEPAAEPSGDNFSDFVRIAGPPKTTAVFSLILSLLLTTGVSLVAWRSLLGAQALGGGALKPLSLSLSEISRNAFGWWQPAGSGLGAAPDNTDLLYWLLSALSFDHANQASAVLLLAAMPLAALFAWFGAGALSRSRAVRFVLSLFWGLSPVLFSALASGRVGAALIHVLLPLLFLAVLRALKAGIGHEPTAGAAGISNASAWTASACAALLLFVISAGSFPFFLLLCVLLYLVAITRARQARTLWWVPLPALVWNLPLLLEALGNPRLLFTEPGVPSAFTPAAPWQQLLGFPEAFDAAGTPLGFGFLPEGPWALVLALLVGAPLVALAVVGTIGSAATGQRTLRSNCRMMVLGALLSLVAGWGIGFIPVGIDSQQTVSAYTGPFVSLTVFALLAAAANAVAALRAEHHAHGHRARGAAPTLKLLAVCSAVSVVACGAVAVAATLDVPAPQQSPTALVAGQQVHASAERSIPATAADAGRGPLQERTLVLRQRADGSIDSELVSGAGQSLDSLSRSSQVAQLTGSLLHPERNENSVPQDLQRQAVAMLLADSTVDARENLRQLGVGYVVLDQAGEPSAMVRTLDAASGLAAIGQTDSGWLWRVTYDDAVDAGTGFARLVAEDGSVQVLDSRRGTLRDVQIPAAQQPRTLVLATGVDSRFNASLDGQQLRPVTYPQDGEQRWAQAFEVPAQGGALNVGYQQLLAVPLLVLGAVVLLVTGLLAIPVPAGRRLSGYRDADFRFREEPVSVGTAHGATVAPQRPEPTMHAEQLEEPAPQLVPDTPLSRRQARERQRELRDQLAPKASDRLSDSSVEQEKK